MSKSKGEFLTVSLLEEKGYNPLVYRFFCLQSHYRKSLVFTWENLDNAKAAWDKLLARIAKLDKNGEVDNAKLEELKRDFVEAMDNDLNTSLAVTALYNALKADTNDATKLALIADYDKVLSLNLIEEAEKLNNAEEPAENDEFAAKIESLIAQRAAAKKEKNFAEADRIRDELKAQGIILEDTAGGTKWKRA
jgi:cysteinyl-tRNA synthetase